MPVDIRGTLTRQVGPLPLYAWGGIGVVAVVVAVKLRGGASATPQTLGQVVDAGGNGGGGDTSGDGNTQQPPPVPGGSGGNGKSYTVLTVTGNTKNYSLSGTNSVALASHIPASSTRYVVKKVTVAGHSFYRIIGKLGTGGVFQPSAPFLHRLIPTSGTTFKVSTTTPTQAAA